MRVTTERRGARWAAGLAAVLAAALAVASSGGAEESPVNRLAAIVDYLCADYPGAVADGRILSPAEYQEQRGLLEEARSLVVMAAPAQGRTRTALAADVERLIRDFGRKAPEASVAADSQGLLTELFDGYGLAVGPIRSPSEARAETLYAASCTPCHGPDGLAHTENARKLTPPPVSFFDPAHMSRLSPRLAYEALELGVSNTAMASFPGFSADDRWSLAFRVVAWRHRAAQSELDRGGALFRSEGVRLAATPSRLSGLSDGELEARLPPSLTSADRAAVLAWLRDVASFTPIESGPFADARRLLREVDAAAGDRTRTTALAERALGEMRPHLLLLRLQDRELARHLEGELAALQRATRAGARTAVEEALVRTSQLLDRAQERDAEGGLAPWAAAAFSGLRDGGLLALAFALALVQRRRRGSSALALLAVGTAGTAPLIWASRADWKGLAENAGWVVTVSGALAGMLLAGVLMATAIVAALRLRGGRPGA